MIQKIKDFLLKKYEQISPYFHTLFQSTSYIIIGVFGLVLLQNTILSSFPAIIGNAGIGLFMMWAYDKFILKNVDTFTIIKRNDLVFGLVYLGWCLIIAAAIIAT